MTTNFGKISIKQKTGEEQLTLSDRETGLKLIDFWRWSVSDIISNATRGRFAEFIVASSLNIDLTIIRDEWGPYDLESPEGIKIEVKSASYLQTWNQRDYSKISFSIKASIFWDSETFTQSEPKRHANIYVFCLLKHKDQVTLDPIKLDQWEFYVVSTSVLNNYKRSKSSITLKSLQNLTPSVTYDHLRQAILDQHSLSEPSTSH
ncbi:MAG: hypothetical protein M0Q53_13500 [Prolixibacteraceae bacterium]|jgi:hypothetical protein|nr:hypothetical protein [Prolixibacteraceae bacterium]